MKFSLELLQSQFSFISLEALQKRVESSIFEGELDEHNICQTFTPYNRPDLSHLFAIAEELCEQENLQVYSNTENQHGVVRLKNLKPIITDAEMARHSSFASLNDIKHDGHIEACLASLLLIYGQESAYFDGVQQISCTKEKGIVKGTSQFTPIPEPHITTVPLNNISPLHQVAASGWLNYVFNNDASVQMYQQDYQQFKKIEFDIEEVETFLGVKLSESKIANILKRRSIDYDGCSGCVSVPSYRKDLLHSQDIMEIIAHHDDTIALLEMEDIKTIYTPVSFPVQKRSKINLDYYRNHMASRGYHEIKTCSLCHKGDNKLLDTAKQAAISITNPMSSQQKYLRVSHLPNLLKVLKRNTECGRQYCQLFELGKCFTQTSEGKFCEKLMLAGISCLRGERHPYYRSFSLGISKITGDIKQLISENCSFVSDAQRQSLCIKEKGLRLGAVYQITDECFGFELEITPHKNKLLTIQEKFSLFPVAKKDISVVCDNTHSYLDIACFVKDCSIPELTKVNLKSIYHKGAKKTISLELVFQSEHETLTDEYLNKYMIELEKLAKVFDKAD